MKITKRQLKNIATKLIAKYPDAIGSNYSIVDERYLALNIIDPAVLHNIDGRDDLCGLPALRSPTKLLVNY